MNNSNEKAIIDGAYQVTIFTTFPYQLKKMLFIIP